jgi:hypothetical protein
MKLNKPMKTILPLAAFAAVTMTGATQAAVITPTIDVALTTHTELGGYELVKAVNSSGLTDPNLTPTIVLDDVNDNGTTQWLNGGAAIGSEVITFDLGGTYDVDSIHLWNWVFSNNTSTKWGVATVDISFSTDGTNFLNTEALSFDPDIAVFGPSSAQTQTFTTQTGVTHIQLNNFTALDSGNRVGFGEIRFGEAVPEPSTTALLGLGGLALILRRRK